jgi:hypothetical protein
VTHFLRIYSPWGQAKLERLRAAGYEVVVLDGGAAKEISGRDVRAALAARKRWRELVPRAVACVLEGLKGVSA